MENGLVRIYDLKKSLIAENVAFPPEPWIDELLKTPGRKVVLADKQACHFVLKNLKSLSPSIERVILEHPRLQSTASSTLAMFIDRLLSRKSAEIHQRGFPIVAADGCLIAGIVLAENATGLEQLKFFPKLKIEFGKSAAEFL